MVSNSVNIQLHELLGTLSGMRAELSNDPEYQKLRDSLPQDWPL